MTKIYKPNEFAQMIGVSVKTLQRWDGAGALVAHRNIKNRRYYTQDQYEAYMKISPNLQKGKTVIYARVSSRNQKDDLNNQVEFLKTFANARGIIVDEICTDIGSGLNYNRKAWNALIDRCVKKEIQTILIAHEDRFIRFGFDWFARFLESLGTNIIVVNNEKLSPEDELVKDLIAIIHVFSCRVYGLRKYKQKLKEDTDVKGI